MYHVTKHYPHSLGLSACFRQPGATSHCKDWHGYALAFTFEFAARTLDANDWVIDFGSLKPLKEWLVDMFDHKMLIREDDPALSDALIMRDKGWATVSILPRVGMEAFANMAFRTCKDRILIRGGYHPRVSLTKVTVAEHEGNSASYSEPL
jgi:6-pyruvoyltetrahydropterin/6-carboxytetrahydropterin synthase